MMSMWTNGKLISPIRPVMIPLPEGYAIMTEGMPDSELARAGWREVAWDQKAYDARPLSW